MSQPVHDDRIGPCALFDVIKTHSVPKHLHVRLWS